MSSRLVHVAVIVLALGAVISGLWVCFSGGQLAGVSYEGVPDSFLLLTLRRLLPERPELFLATLRAYALAVMLAGGLALLLIVRARQIQAASLLAGALAGLAFFTAHLSIVYNIPGLAAGAVVQALDYLALVGFFYGACAIMHAAHHYPHQMGFDAIVEYGRARPDAFRKFRERVIQPYNGKPWLRWSIRMGETLDENILQGLRSAWSPTLLSVAAGGILVLWQLHHRGVVVSMGMLVLMVVATICYPRQHR